MVFCGAVHYAVQLVVLTFKPVNEILDEATEQNSPGVLFIVQLIPY